MTSFLPLSLFPSSSSSTRRFRLPSRKKPHSLQQQQQQRKHSSPFDALPIELLAKILDYFHTKEVKLSLTLVNRNFALASKRCTHVYAIGPSFSPMNNLLREMQLEEIGCLSSKAMHTTKQQFFANRKLEGVVIAVVRRGGDSLVLLQQHKMDNTSLIAAYRASNVAPGVDMFGRAYERTAKMQLQCNTLEKYGKAWRFRDDALPNLPRHGNGDLYAELEALITCMVPKMEPAVAYAKRLAPNKSVMSGSQLLVAGKRPALLGEEMEPLPRYDLQSRAQLQVYVHVEDLELKPGDTVKCTAWQVAGLPQEHIVCTAEYYLQRDDALLEKGGAREFKRGMLVGEAALVELAAQWPRVGSVFPDGLVALGQQPVEENMLVVFPNTHVSRVGQVTNVSKTQVAKQRKLTVWLVDPDVTCSRHDNNSVQLASWQQVAQERSKMRQNWNTFPLYMAAAPPQRIVAGGGGGGFYM